MRSATRGTRSAGRLLRRYGIGALCLMAMVVIIRSSLDPGQYFHYGDEPTEPVENPIGTVAFIVGVFIAEAGILYSLLLPWRAGWSWHRALAAFLVFAVWLWLCTFVVVHAPGYVLLHAGWVFVVVVGLALNLLGSVAWSFRQRYRRNPGPSGAKAAV